MKASTFGILTCVIVLLAACGKTSTPGSGSIQTNTQGGNGNKPVEHHLIGSCDTGGSPFGAGDGSAGNPFQICTTAHLAAIAAQTNTSASYVLEIDLDMTGAAYYPVSVFSGTFDGQNHNISNYSGFGPLFWNSSGTIQNLNMPGLNMSGSSRSGSIVGWNGTTGQVINCSASGSFTTSFMTGGLVGQNDGKITGCTANVNISGYDHVGGLVGVNRGIITNCSATGTVTAGGDYDGGLVGQSQGGSVIHSFATGNVNGQNSSGGLVGDNNPGSITASYATGNVTGQTNVGGLVGSNTNGSSSNATITNAYASGSATGQSKVGGFVGSNTGTITNGYSYGQVSAGGGGLVAVNSGTVTSSYWDSIASGMSTSAAGTSEVTSAMQTQGTYTGWDFSAIWSISAGQYPKLR